MSRASTVAAVAAYLDPAVSGITNLSNVYGYPAKITNEGEFALGNNAGTGALIFIALEQQFEKRIAIGGAHNGRKWRQYTCVLLCFLRSVNERSQDVGQANDDFLDSLIARIEADRNLGTAPPPGTEIGPGVIFQAGEGSDNGGQDLMVESDLPRLLAAQMVQIFSSVRMTVAEVLDT